MKNRLSAQVRNKSLEKNTAHANGGDVDALLLELVRLRVAQIHRNPVSIEMHIEKLKGKGETKKRLDQLETWGTSPLFSEIERAALALCDKITSDSACPLPEYLIQEARHYFTKGAIVNLTVAIMSVNDWHFSPS